MPSVVTTPAQAVLDAKSTALVLVDVQPEYWCDTEIQADFPHFPARCASLLETCRNAGVAVVFVRAHYSKAQSPWKPHFSRLCPNISTERLSPHQQTRESMWEAFAAPEAGEPVVAKHSWNATQGSELIAYLRGVGVESVLVSGLITSVCVQHSAYGLFEAGFRTVLVEDACADRGRARHEAALALYGNYMYEVIQSHSLRDEAVLRNVPEKKVPELRQNESAMPALMNHENVARYVAHRLAAVGGTGSSSTAEKQGGKGDAGPSCVQDKFASDREETKDKTAALQHLLSKTAFMGNGTDIVFAMDLDAVEANAKALLAAFPAHSLHAFAIKANPAKGLVALLAGLGLGIEAASWGEVLQALACGVAPAKIVYDSPAKSRPEVVQALELGISFNIDNLEELALVAGLVDARGQQGQAPSSSRIGIRVNTQHGTGSIAATSTATSTSKFGVALGRDRAAVLHAFETHPWLCGLHAHGGSYGCGLELLVEGARVLMGLLDDIQKTRTSRKMPKLSFVDIGGGVPVDFVSATYTGLFQEYAALLKARVPQLFADPELLIVTEMGISLTGPFGWTAARVKYVKGTGLDTSSGHNIAVTDYGADCDPRNVYMPGVYHRRLSVYDDAGHFRPTCDNALEAQDIAGPLCFSGDMLTKQRQLPRITAGDIIMVHNTGANTLSMYLRHTSRQAPAMVGYRRLPPSLGAKGEAGDAKDAEPYSWTVLKSAETSADVLRFWDQA